MLHFSASMQFPEPVPNFELAPVLPPTLPGAKRSPSQMSGTLSWNTKGHPFQYFHRVRILPLIPELRGLDYESPDDGELSDDTISNGRRPAPTNFNGTNYKSKVVDWRSNLGVKAYEQRHSATPSESGDSFVSNIQHYADGVEMGNWMLGNPNRARADAYHH